MDRRAGWLLVAIVALVLLGVVVADGTRPTPSAPIALASASQPTIAATASPPIFTPASGPATPGATLAGPSSTPSPRATVRLVRDGSRAEADPVLTPGAADPTVTQASIHTTICVAGYTATVRPPSSYTTALKRQQIALSGDTDTNLADYEEDHLIPLEVGGAPRDPANLWPEPYDAIAADGTPAGARVKDRFENWLHDQVCSGAMLLVAAQQQIAGDWVANWEAAGRP
jgi:hypothetical protein